jgi:hypothetical protein
MMTSRVTIFVGVAVLAAAQPAPAQEIYRWVDEQGVVHFSDTAPGGASGEISTLTLDGSPPAAYDPEQDIYNLAATGQRMQALRDEMAAQRDARRERAAAQPPVVVQYPEQQHSGYANGYLYGYPRPPGGHPGRPPFRPPHGPPPGTQPPVDETSTWRPPGRPSQFRQ